MILPDFSREEKLFKKGYQKIAGLDEVGRGTLAGPVVAAAVIFSLNAKTNELKKIGVRDSKLLSAKKRDYLYEKIIENCIDWSVGIVSQEVIDEINVLRASIMAMKKAAESLKIKPDFLLIDGNFTISDYPVSQLAVPSADKYIFSVSAASIVAKVTRDKLLVEMDEKYPGYGFARHKGYGTKGHMEALMKKGPCGIHRRSFGPVSEIINGPKNKGLAK